MKPVKRKRFVQLDALLLEHKIRSHKWTNDYREGIKELVRLIKVDELANVRRAKPSKSTKPKGNIKLEGNLHY